MIIVVGGIKGGSGKSTVATNLAIMRSQDRDVLLVDADDQETATDFTILRNDRREGGAGYTSIKLSGQAVRTEVKSLASKYQDIIIDTGGRDTTSQRAALTVADVLLVPFVPRSFDLWTVEQLAALVAEVKSINDKLQPYVFINRADPSGEDNIEAAESLKEIEGITFLDTPLGTRKVFGNAAANGLAVTEYKPENDKAIKEMMTLFEFVFNVKSTLKVVGA